jgi:penicillin amidase
LYRPVTSGTVYLENAPGTATITFEDETGIAHIRGDSLLSAVYAQGFQHAQTRLWQMYKNRALFNGEISEIFGAVTLPLDKFARTVGYKRLADKKWSEFTTEHKAIY